MTVRQPFRAGSFYEGDGKMCQSIARQLLDSAVLPSDLPEKIYGGIVPHAGWVYSGQVAALTIKAVLCQPAAPQTVVIFGADHTGEVYQGEVFAAGKWLTPIGNAAVDEELTRLILAESELFRDNPSAHQYEHSIEVQVPLLLQVNPDIKIVPIAIPPQAFAEQLGTAVASAIQKYAKPVAIIGSTDLTHHGGHFGNPGGHGVEGVEYAVENDRKIINLIEKMKIDKIIPEARKHQNACGAGAITAAMAACKQLGAAKGSCLQYTNSYEITRKVAPGSPNDITVGYASIIFE